jgi:hypothetical protein
VIERLALQDDEVVARTRAGKAGVFAALMQRYKLPAISNSRSILKDDAEAEEAVQETYIRAFYLARRLPRLGQSSGECRFGKARCAERELFAATDIGRLGGPIHD